MPVQRALHPLTRATASRCVIFTKLDGSLLAFVEFVKLEGLKGLYAAWPRPSLEAWSFIVGHGVLQAALQLLMPGKAHKGPVTPAGNVPLYKVPQFTLECAHLLKCPHGLPLIAYLKVGDILSRQSYILEGGLGSERSPAVISRLDLPITLLPPNPPS